MVAGNPVVKEFYSYIADKLDLLSMFSVMLDDITTYSESCAVGYMDLENLEWDRFEFIKPEFLEMEYVDGKPTYAVKGEDDQHQVLNKDRVIYVTSRKSLREDRGLSLLRRAINDLSYENMVRHLQQVIIDRHSAPLVIFKLGSSSLKWIPPESHFVQLKELLIQAVADPAHQIIFHFGLEVEYVTTNDKVEALGPHFDLSTKRILNAFYVNPALIDGEAPGYAVQTMDMRLLMYRFALQRSKIIKPTLQTVYGTTAKLNNLIDTNNALEGMNNTTIKSSKFRESRYLIPSLVLKNINLLS